MNNLTVNLGEKIKVLRERGGFTQSNIATYLKVDQSLISKFEKGERAITSDMLDKLSALFGMQLSAFKDDEIIAKPLYIALRTNELDNEDMEVISAINRIALNCNFITQLLEENNING